MNRRTWLRTTSASLLAWPGLAGLSSCRKKEGPKLDLQAYQSDIRKVIKQHAEVCASAYRNAWQKADGLKAQIELFLAQPTAQSFGTVRESWTQALLAYMETEGLRGFTTPADTMHRRIQAWPVDPEKLDIAPGKPRSGIVYDKNALPNVTPERLVALHRPSTGDVFIGFHALEFLIYGVDLYDDGGGYRAYTDYTKERESSRRARILQELANLLSQDLKQLSDAWHPAQQGNYRAQFMAKASTEALQIIFSGLISVCSNGLEGKLTRALASGDQRDEVCNFSDTSLQAIRHALIGLQKAFSGAAPGRVVAGEEQPLLSLIALADPTLAANIDSGFTSMLAQLEPFDEPFDQLIKKENASARSSLNSVAAALEKQHGMLQDAARALGVRRGQASA